MLETDDQFAEQPTCMRTHINIKSCQPTSVCVCVCVCDVTLLPVGENSAAVVNTDGQNFICDHFIVIWPTEVLNTHTHTHTHTHTQNHIYHMHMYI